MSEGDDLIPWDLLNRFRNGVSTNRAYLNALGLPKKHTLPKSDSGPI
jgi:hypothetical protein